MKRQLKHIAIIITMALICTWGWPGIALAFTGFEPGVAGSGEYKEVVFLGGQPELFTGSVKETSRTRGETVQTSLTYKLTNVKGDKLNRSLKLSSQKTKKDNQEVYVTSLDSFQETVETGGQKYKAKKDGVFFNSTRVIDHQPVIDFVSGNWYLKRIYEVGKAATGGTLEISGTFEGYSSSWGEGETRNLQVKLEGEQLAGVPVQWQGSAQIVMKEAMSRTLGYAPTRPDLISFTGGFVDEQRREQELTVDYDLPLGDGEYTISAQSPPQQQRLFVKEFKDLRGHWAQNPIESLCGLGAFDAQGNYFSPGLPARRGEFIKALVVVGGLQPEPASLKTTRQTRDGEATETPYFFDVNASNPWFDYIQIAGKKGLIESDAKLFRPNENLTRAEAVTLLVKALGLENLAPAPIYATDFYDDFQIPLWAKDAVYVAHNYGLIRGDFTGGMQVFRPNDVVTRAEAAAMLDKFRDFLNRDFRRDYL